MIRRSPPSWTIEELDACFVVIDSAGQKLAYFDNLLAGTIKSQQFRSGDIASAVEIRDYSEE
jgi:hypothetical protein